MPNDDDRLPGYYVSRDQESFTIGPYRTRKKAVDVAPAALSLKQGDKFYVCLARWETRLFGPDADEVIERARQAAEDNAPRDWGPEFLSEVSNEAITDLGGMLEQTWEVWLDRHNLRPKWFEATEVTKHVVPTLEALLETFRFAIGGDAEQRRAIASMTARLAYLQSELEALRRALNEETK